MVGAIATAQRECQSLWEYRGIHLGRDTAMKAAPEDIYTAARIIDGSSTGGKLHSEKFKIMETAFSLLKRGGINMNTWKGEM